MKHENIVSLDFAEIEEVAGGPLFALAIPAIVVKAVKFTAVVAGTAAVTAGATKAVVEVADAVSD
jgi:hypothetical protein